MNEPSTGVVPVDLTPWFAGAGAPTEVKDPPTTSGEHLLAKLMGPRELRHSTAAPEFMS